MEYESLKNLAENAYGYLNTQEGTYALIGVGSIATAAAGRWLMSEIALPVLKSVLVFVISLFRSKQSELVQEVLRSLDDPHVLLNESLTGSNPDELMTNTFVVKYERPNMPSVTAVRSVSINNRDVFDVLTHSEKKQVVKKLARTVARVKLRDWTNSRNETLRVLRSEILKSDAHRRV